MIFTLGLAGPQWPAPRHPKAAYCRAASCPPLLFPQHPHHHERFTYKYQGLDTRLTGVEKAEAVKALLA